MSEINENKWILNKQSDPKYTPDNRGYGVASFEKMLEFSDRVAQIDVETNQPETYGEILQKTIRVALEMKSMGITSNDIISLCTTSGHSETCHVFWAATFLGSPLANLDPSLSLSELKHLGEIIKPRLIFCTPESVEILETLVQELNLESQLVVFGETDKHISFKNFLKPSEEEKTFKPKVANDEFDTVLIMFSSGTTGLPKGVCLTHYSLLSATLFLTEYFNAATLLFYSTPYWISFPIFLSTILFSGGKRLLCKTYDSNNVLQIIQDFKVTCIFIVPALTYTLTSNLDNCKYDTSSLQSFMLGGSIITDEQVRRLKKIFPHTLFNKLYGLSELSAVFSSFHPIRELDLILSKHGSCGRMMPDTTCKVVDIDTNEIVGPNRRGELLIKSKRLMSGYYKKPEETRQAYDEDGFFHTGDVVYYDEDHCFYIVDRVKEMFKYKGWHIIPPELENILLQHPAVKEALVIGIPHEVDGDHPMAVIVLKPGMNVIEKNILKYFNDQVTDRKQLRAGIKFMENIPKTITGKYNRRKLRDIIINKTI